MFEPGTKIDRYVIEEKLGEGGMAVVYRVRHRTLGTRHALKLLTHSSPGVRQRLVREGQVQATLKHPNIVAVTDVIEHEGVPGLVLEYIEGPSLDVWLNHYMPSTSEALAIFRGILLGVGAAHSAGLVHRDLKPGNVMLHVTDAGTVPKVADFGLVMVRDAGSRFTRTGSTMGTPVYMAPEQIRDASKVDRRADLYSLGVMLYELVCGNVPYYSEDLIELFQLVVAQKRAHPGQLRQGVPDAVVATIDALMAVQPGDRPLDCASTLELLAGVELEELTLDLPPLDGDLPAPRAMPTGGMDSQLAPDSAGTTIARRFVRTAVHVPSQPSEAPAPAPVERRGVPLTWFVAVVFTLLLGGGALAVMSGGVAFFASRWPWREATTEQPVESPPPVVPSLPVQPLPIPVSEEPVPEKPMPEKPVPVVSNPRVSPKTPVPDVVPVAVVAPVPPKTVPRPAPVEVPKPMGRLKIEREPGTEHVYISGEAGDFGSGEVPSGTYRVYARFKGEAIREFPSITIETNKTTTLVCSFAQVRCVALR